VLTDRGSRLLLGSTPRTRCGPAKGFGPNTRPASARWLPAHGIPSWSATTRTCRSAADGRVFPWGFNPATPGCEQAVTITDEKPESCAVDRPAARPFTRPVCSRPKGISAEGLCDLTGNVPEWVSDWYISAESKRGGAGRNPRGPCPGHKKCPGARGHIIKGGGWRDDEFFSRIPNRNNPSKPYVVSDAGFRCATSAEK
jgi:formylglycine-generating enzyme